MDLELQKQKPLIEQTKKEMTKINTRMERANTRIKNLISSQSYCCLYMVILAEVVLFLLLVLL